jgi:hypothetical protein
MPAGVYFPGNEFLKKISVRGILTRGGGSPVPGFRFRGPGGGAPGGLCRGGEPIT